MESISLLRDLVVAMVAATIAGIIALRLGLPVIIGYLVCGLLIGPNALGIISDISDVSRLADIGVALLMFAVGVSLSFERMRSVGRISIYGGIAQVLLTIALGLLLGLLFGWRVYASIFVGAMIASSSTMTVIKTLIDRSELDSMHGRVSLGISVVQDMGVIALLAILPPLRNIQLASVPDLIVPVARGFVVLAAAIYAANTVIPFILRRVAMLNSRELFMLTLVILAVGAATATAAMGFSLALGAFVAGLVISQSELRQESISRIIPMRDVFVAVFFVSVGMLINPVFIYRNPGAVLMIALATIVGKFLICGGLALWYKYSGLTAVLVGILLGQAGEFTFVMGQAGVAQNLIDDFYFSATLSAALISLIVAPLVYQHGRKLYERLPPIPRLRQVRDGHHRDVTVMHNHTILCGYGRVGRNVGIALQRFSISFVVIDYDLDIIHKLKKDGIQAIYGDAGSESVVAEANPEHARMAVVVLPDLISTRMTVRSLHEANPRLKILARTSDESAFEDLVQQGATEVFQVEFEAGLEIMRHTLFHLGKADGDLQAYIEGIRRNRYREMEKGIEELND